MEFSPKRVFLFSYLNVMPAINFNFISNNVKRLELTKKRIKLFE